MARAGLNGAAASEARPPVQWDAKKNVKWVTPIPGEGSSTPVAWEDQLFVLSAQATDRKSDKPADSDPDDKTTPPDVYYKFIVTSVDRQTGNVRWQQVATEQVPHEGKHQTHTYAAGSPVTDGKHLYASFSSRGIFAYTLDGQWRWQVDLGDMQTRFGWGEAVTPRLLTTNDCQLGSRERLVHHSAGHCYGQTVVARRATGEVTSWNTPLIVKDGTRTLVVVNGTHRVKAYDAATGQEVWACGGQTVNAIPSPVQFKDTVIA